MPRATSSGSTCTKTQTQLFAGGTQPLCKCTLHVLLAAPADMWDRLTASSFYKERSFLPRNQKPKGQGFRLLFGLFFPPLSLPGHPQIFQFPGIYFLCISRNKLAVCLLEKLFALLNVPKICRDLKVFVAKFQCKTMV